MRHMKTLTPTLRSPGVLLTARLKGRTADGEQWVETNEIQVRLTKIEDDWRMDTLEVVDVLEK